MPIFHQLVFFISAACKDSYVLFTSFINDLDAGFKVIISKFANSTKLGGATDSFQNREASQRVLDYLESWTVNNNMKFNKSNTRFYTRDIGTPGYTFRPVDKLDSNPTEGYLGILVNSKSNMSQECVLPLQPKWQTISWGASKRALLVR